MTAVESILADAATSPKERLSALRALERIESAARRRAEERESNLPEPVPAPEPTVDQLVSDLEKAQNQPPQPIENKGAENDQTAVNAVTAPPVAAKALEATQTPESTPTAFCGFCSAAGTWNTRWPVEEPNGVLLCPTCFAKMCAADMRQTAAASLARQDPPRSWLYGQGTDPNTNDISDLRGMNRDYQNSVQIWQQQAREDADRQALEAAERSRLETDLNRRRAEYISRHGQLAPHDTF